MLKISLIIIAIYLLYYAGNIIYDLFLKDSITAQTEDTEEFSFEHYEEENNRNVTTVGIEDVENLTTPKSFSKKEILVKNEFSEERPKMDYWRERFESEESIDLFESKDVDEGDLIEEFEAEKDSLKITEENKKNYHIEQKLESIKKFNSENWTKILNLSESMVQLVKNVDGHKVYHTSLL
jgi:hypothetical protein